MARFSAAVSTLAVLLSEPCGGIPLKQEFKTLFKTRRHHKHSDLLSSGAASKYPEQWYTDQTLDHFNSEDTRTFKQLYFANFDHYKPGGPVLITIGGEGPLSANYVAGYMSNVMFAEKFNGAVVALEHRFYGKSQPFDSLATEHLEYLTSKQALHDLAQFQRWFTQVKTNPPMNGSAFCMGGSYPGNLAAWYRLEFPELTAGCWSSSAPVQAQETWPGFGEMVWKAVATDSAGTTDFSLPVKLYAGYEQIANLVQDGTVEGFAALKKAFNVCPGTLVSRQDRDSFESAVSSAVGSVMQYNNTRAPRLSAVRDIIINASTPFDAALSVSKFLNLTQDDGECTDNSISGFYKLLGDTTLPDDGSANAARTWTWQTCNEFGYFQTATGNFGSPTMYTRGASSRSMWQQVCSDLFAISPAGVSARIAATNRYYGGKNPKNIKNVLFSNGELDAWSLLGVTSYPDNDREVYAEVAPLGSHCVGLYSPEDGEVPGATSIRNKALALFTKWGARAAAVSTEAPLVI